MSPEEIRLPPHVNQKDLVYFEIQLIQSSNGVLAFVRNATYCNVHVRRIARCVQ